MPLPPAVPELAHRYLRLTPADVDLGYAGRYGLKNQLHHPIEELSVDDSLVLRRAGERSELLDGKGNVLGGLSGIFPHLRE